MRAELAALVALSALGGTSCGRRVPDDKAPGGAAEGKTKDEAPGEGKNDRKRVRCAAATERQLGDAIELRGTVAPLPDRDAQVAPQIAGRILKVTVREGDRVRPGDVLAVVDAAPLADLVAEAQAGVDKARAETENAKTTLARVQRVFERGIAARQEVDDASARAASARASEDQAAAALRRANLQVARATVRSPLGGVVLKLYRRSGELVDGTPATPVVEVGDPSSLELVADAPAQDLVRLRRGGTATVSIAALPDRAFPARVAAVAPAVDRVTGLGVVRFSLELGRGPVPPVGVFGVARAETGAARRATVVPAAALRSLSGAEAEVVACAPDHTAHVVRVRVGARVDDLVEVTGSAGAPKPGDPVAVEPVLGLAEGDKLEPQP